MGIVNAQIKVAAKSIVPGTNGSSTYTESVVILPANAYVMDFFGRVKTAFTGLTKPKVSLGVAGDTSRYMVAQPVDALNEFMFGPPAKANDALLGVKKFCVKMDKERVFSSAQPILATFTSDSATFDSVTGEVEFVVVYVTLN